MFSSSSGVALHWDFVKGKILTKAARSWHAGRTSLTFQGLSQMEEGNMHKRRWLNHGKHWETRPVRYFVNDLIDSHHQLVCFILPSPQPPRVRAPHCEFYRQNVRLEVEVCCAWVPGFSVLCSDSHTYVMVVATGGADNGKRKMWGNFDIVYRFLQKSVANGREHQSNQGKWIFCSTFPGEWLNEGVSLEQDSLLGRTPSLWGHCTLRQVPVNLSVWLCTAWKCFINN